MTPTAAPPTGAVSATLLHQLEPVREALLRDATAQADQIIAAAIANAEDLVAGATADADREVERARHRTELSAQANAAQELARVRNDGHRVVLGTQSQVKRQLVQEVSDSIQDLRRDPRYPALLDHLETLARSQLGNDAVIERDPQTGGGIVAVAGSRRVDYRLAALADRALDALADDVAKLWN